MLSWTINLKVLQIENQVKSWQMITIVKTKCFIVFLNVLHTFEDLPNGDNSHSYTTHYLGKGSWTPH